MGSVKLLAKEAVIEAFIKLHEKGLIYQGSYLVNWSPNLQTAVSDLEVEYSEEPGALYHIKYRVAGQSDFLTVATTRPGILFGDVAIAVNPKIIEPLVSKQWFVTMEPLAEKALRAVEKGELTIMPERFEKIYNHWLSNIKDWCISRQLWWGHRIPVWYVLGKNCEEDYIVAKNADEALERAREKYGKNVEIYQDPDVLDTWFSSALWPFSTPGWPDVSAEDFRKFYPTTMLETGHGILFFWVARMIMMGIEFTGTVPFSYVYLHGLIRDSQGRKMSKTLGNVIDPLDTIKEFGTDALRFTISLGTAGQDLNLSTERLTANKAFTNKLWNAGKFVLQNLPSQTDVSAWEAIMDYKFDKEESVSRLPLPECWVVSKLHVLIDMVTTSYDKFFFGDVGRETYDFFWSDFADWYIKSI